MLRVLPYRDLLLRQHITTLKPSFHFNDLLHQNQNPLLRFISNISESTNQPTFKVDYLVKKCGLPPQKAISTAEKITSFSIEKADSVISILQNHGLPKTHIAVLISKRPTVLSYDSNKTLIPKLKFLKDSGVSGSLLLKLITCDSSFLSRSLQNYFVPRFNFLKSYISTDSDILILLNRWPLVLQYDPEKTLKPNISILQVHGVPDRNISKLLTTQPRALCHTSDRFKEMVETVEKIGLNPLSPMFIVAVRTMSAMRKSNWDKKLMVYRELGWSDNNILSAFKKHPHCMGLSAQKIKKGVGFFLEKLKLKPSEISFRPNLLLLSLEKRIIPRCAVLQILYSKGIIRKKVNLGTVLNMSERNFLEKFVINYQDSVPEVMKAYEGGIEFAELESFFKVMELPMEADVDHVTPGVTAV